MIELLILYILVALVFGAAFGNQYFENAKREGMMGPFPYITAATSALCWPINIVLTLVYGFRNR